MSQHNIMLINRGFSDINPLLAGMESCEPLHSYGPNKREYYLIHYVLSGRGYFETEGKTYYLEEGGMFFLRPGQAAYYQADGEDPWTYSWVGFTCAMNLNELFCQNVIFSEECRKIFSDIINCEKQQIDREMYICGKIFELIAVLNDCRSTEHERENRYVMMAKNHIENYYFQKIGVSELAEHLNLDRSYFSTLFKAHTGKSPQQYLVDYRLEKAASLMKDQDYSPSEAALCCGYPDIFNFSKMFKKKYGIAPKHYKNSFKKGKG